MTGSRAVTSRDHQAIGSVPLALATPRASGPGPSLGTTAVRILTAVVIGALMLAGGVSSLGLLLLVVITVLAVDTHNLCSLKNFFLAYTVAVFGIGGGVLHLTGSAIYRDIVAYLVVFLAGYALASLRATPRPTTREGIRRPAGRGPLNLFVLEHALMVLVGLNLLFLAFQFLKYGVVGYYQGQGLLDQALTYGKASAGGGFEQIVRFALSDSAVALVLLYVRGCFESSTAVRYRWAVTLFVALPILSLSRFNAVVGALTLLAVYACDRRVSRRRAGHGRGKGAATVRSRPLNKGAVVVLGLVLAIATAAFVASLRGGFANRAGRVGTAPDTVAMFTSELSPVQAYGDIRANIAILGHTHGRTIVLPFLLKVVPRAWYPNKPLNSGAYYMATIRPGEWAAGYALPPTFFGDAFLSFGFGGALVACVALGLLAGRLDEAFKQMILGRLPWFLLIFANFYALLRDPMSESLAAIALTAAVWVLGNRLFRVRVPAAAHQAAA